MWTPGLVIDAPVISQPSTPGKLTALTPPGPDSNWPCQPRTRPHLARMRELPHTKSCFVCGESNPVGLRLRFETDGTIVHARFVPEPQHVGFQQVVHGGLLSTVLDEIMVWACAVRTRRFAFCAELNVRFLRPVRPAQIVQATGRLVNDRRGRVFEAAADLADPAGILLASATGKYLPLKSTDTAEMLSDFVGDPAWLSQSLPDIS
jgi:uncharacterized protein (TIGR00369 family)